MHFVFSNLVYLNATCMCIVYYLCMTLKTRGFDEDLEDPFGFGLAVMIDLQCSGFHKQ